MNVNYSSTECIMSGGMEENYFSFGQWKWILNGIKYNSSVDLK